MESSDALDKLWDRFLEHWPIERLESLSLTEYSSQGTDDSFCYWLESVTEKLGSIWGGSAFKFGVYARKDRVIKQDGRGRCYSRFYGWMAKYGGTAEEAFESVHSEIIKVARAAQTGNLDLVQRADLGEAIRWKIAFLYQNRDQLKVLPIYKGSMLKVLTGQSKLDTAFAYQQLLDKQGNAPFFEYAAMLWSEANQLLAQELTAAQAQAYFDESSDYLPINPPTQYIAGYESLSGNQIALVRQNKKVTLFFSAGPWIEKVRNKFVSVKEYKASDTRNSNLSANAADLAKGNAAYSVVVDSLAALEDICAAYENDIDGLEVSEIVSDLSEDSLMSFPLNQILYGPPGTGKTYATSEMAVKIAEPVFYQEVTQEDDEHKRRKMIKTRYDELVASNRVGFATFHQSFCYEDFIEGIRAKTSEDDGGLVYEVEDGIFKKLAALAGSHRSESVVDHSISLEGRRIWKMSLGNTLRETDEGYQNCLELGYIGLGYGGEIDFRDCASRGAVSEKFSEKTGKSYDHTAYNVSAVNTFKNVIQNGDIVVISDGNHRFRAIAEVTGDYEYSVDDEYHFFQRRSVIWHQQFEPSLPKEALFKKSLSQMTLYELKSKTIIMNRLEEFLSEPSELTTEHRNYVLILDEINRGNIARIFGELITLLEPDKRKNGADERSVILPYSKESFTVPENLYVIGTMNTADKSLAQLDLALRRRFDFVEVMPDANLLEGIEVFGVSIVNLLNVINARIEVLLDRDHLIGHSYFLPLRSAGADKESLLASIFENRIIPLLQEYFFSDWERIGWVLNDIDKSWDERFIQLQHDVSDLNSLFSSKVTDELQDRRYNINSSAFNKAAAYQGILLGNTPE